MWQPSARATKRERGVAEPSAGIVEPGHKLVQSQHLAAASAAALVPRQSGSSDQRAAARPAGAGQAGLVTAGRVAGRQRVGRLAGFGRGWPWGGGRRPIAPPLCASHQRRVPESLASVGPQCDNRPASVQPGKGWRGAPGWRGGLAITTRPSVQAVFTWSSSTAKKSKTVSPARARSKARAKTPGMVVPRMRSPTRPASAKLGAPPASSEITAVARGDLPHGAGFARPRWTDQERNLALIQEALNHLTQAFHRPTVNPLRPARRPTATGIT
jgi:hypothetical protein